VDDGIDGTLTACRIEAAQFVESYYEALCVSHRESSYGPSVRRCGELGDVSSEGVEEGDKKIGGAVVTFAEEGYHFCRVNARVFCYSGSTICPWINAFCNIRVIVYQSAWQL
jgi:hypothetical protein